MTGASDGKIPDTSERGRLRAARADREHVIGVLKTAFMRGMLDKGEFDQRVGQTLGSRTYGELASLTADLPAGLPAAVPLAARPPAPAPEEGWLTMRRAVIISACLLVPTALATLLGVPVVDRYHQPALIMFPVVAFFLATLVSVPLLAEARHRQRARPRRPRVPAAGAASQPELGSRPGRRGSPGGDLTLAVTA